MNSSLPSVPSAELLTEKLRTAVAWAEEAGKLTPQDFQQENYEVERKSDASPVTVADRSAEQLIRARIADQFACQALRS